MNDKKSPSDSEGKSQNLKVKSLFYEKYEKSMVRFSFSRSD